MLPSVYRQAIILTLVCVFFRCLTWTLVASWQTNEYQSQWRAQIPQSLISLEPPGAVASVVNMINCLCLLFQVHARQHNRHPCIWSPVPTLSEVKSLFPPPYCPCAFLFKEPFLNNNEESSVCSPEAKLDRIERRREHIRTVSIYGEVWEVFFFVAKEIFFIGRFGTWLRRGRSSLLHLQVITSRFSRFQNYLSETLLVVHSIIGLFMPHSNPIPNSNLPPGLLLLGLEHLARTQQHLRSLLPNASYLFQLPLLLSKAHFLHLQGKTL